MINVEDRAARSAAPAPRVSIVVGIGASAGGLEGLQALLECMPPDTGFVFVVVQHLERHHPSVLAELLARHTKMTVKQVEDGERAQPDHVYIIAPNTVLLLNHGLLRVLAPASSGVRTPIDAFFVSLAEDQEEGAVGIILSGTGTDGTVGMRAMKEHGGLTLAQAPETARYDSMPQSVIAAGLVDYVLPVEGMPARLREYAEHLAQIRRVQAKVFDDEIAANLKSICATLQRHTGHDFSCYKQGTLIRRIGRRVRTHDVASATEYARRLDHEPEEAKALLRDLLIGVTEFFRDPEVFEALAQQAFPAIFAGDPTAPVRIWVPGCASGEEAYSIAILALEHLARLKQQRVVQIFATDIDTEMLAIARQGLYPQDIARHVSADRLARFFHKEGASFQIVKALREMCTFSVHSLIKDPPFSSVDLISCRNLLIYLGSDLQRKLVPLFHFALRPEGHLLLGPSEELAGYPELFTVVDKKHRLYRRSEAVTRPPLELPVASRFLSRGAAPARLAGIRSAVPVGQLTLSEAFERMIREEYAPPSAVINERGDILYLAGQVGLYLQSREGPPTNNILDLTQGSLRIEMRAALAKAVKFHRKTTRENVSVDVADRTHHLRLTVRPMPGLAVEAGLYAVVFQVAEPPRAPAQEEEAAENATSSEPLVIEQLENELRTTRADLQSAMEELETSNEELKSANEELISTNEELQSANEELHSSNEELQSSREELQTVNDELRDNMQALDAASAELMNHYAGMQLATVIADRELRIGKFTPAAREFFHLEDGDMGRPIATLASRFRDEDLLADVQTVLSTETGIERHVQTVDGGRWFLMRLLPYRDSANAVSGVGINCVDITDLRRAEEVERRFGGLSDAIFSWRLDGGIDSWNRGAEELYGFGATEARGQAPAHLLKTVYPCPWVEIEEAVRTSGKWQGELLQHTRDDRAIFVSSKIELVRGDDGVDRVLEANRDITARRRAEDALRQADQRKNEFLAVLSHELRNPLTPIRNSLYILDRAVPGGEQARRAKGVIDRQVEQLGRLVDDLLDMTRISSGKIHMKHGVFDLSALLRRSVDDHRSQLARSAVELEVHISEKPLLIEGDEARISQAVGNLLTNAAKFTPEQGRVVLSLEEDAQRRRAVICVRDTGVGIDAEMLPRLFVPFVQADGSLDRSMGGLGLGLALVRELVAMHGGEVDAQSAGLGLGAEFRVWLPLARQHATASNNIACRKPTYAPRRVLIIEDHIEVASTLSEVLTLDGCHVEIAYNGSEGLERARTFKPDIVLCDIGLPGTNGYDVARAFRADPALRGMFLVALTGYAMPEDIEKAKAAGFSDHLAKPPNMARLAEIIAMAPSSMTANADRPEPDN